MPPKKSKEVKPKRGRGRPKGSKNKPPKRGPGRPSAFTKQIRDIILDGIRHGMSKRDSCKMAGVDPTTVCGWVREGEAKGEGPYFKFAQSYKTAGFMAEKERNRLIEEHGKNDWKALAWLNERTKPSRYARRMVHKHDGPVPHEDLDQHREPAQRRAKKYSETKDDSLAFWRSIRDAADAPMADKIKAQERIDILMGHDKHERETDDARNLAMDVLQTIGAIQKAGGPPSPPGGKGGETNGNLEKGGPADG